MSSRLSQALRELAAALEETESEKWELVSGAPEAPKEAATPEVKSGGRDSSPARPAGSTAISACGSDVVYHVDWRHYIVVANPTGELGYVCGPAASTWPRLEKRLRGGKLAGSGARLRRVESQKEAEEVWKKAHGEKPMPHLRV